PRAIAHASKTPRPRGVFFSSPIEDGGVRERVFFSEPLPLVGGVGEGLLFLLPHRRWGRSGGGYSVSCCSNARCANTSPRRVLAPAALILLLPHRRWGRSGGGYSVSCCSNARCANTSPRRVLTPAALILLLPHRRWGRSGGGYSVSCCSNARCANTSPRRVLAPAALILLLPHRRWGRSGGGYPRLLLLHRSSREHVPAPRCPQRGSDLPPLLLTERSEVKWERAG